VRAAVNLRCAAGCRRYASPRRRRCGRDGSQASTSAPLGGQLAVLPVAPDNGEVNETTTAALVAASGGVGAFLGSAVTTLFNSRAQERAHRREQLRRDADALGPIREYLETTIAPRRVAMNAPVRGEDAQAVHEKLLAQRDQHLAAVNVMAAGHPDARVRAAAKEFATELFNAGHSVGWLLREDRHDSELREAADEDHRKALDLYGTLHKLTTAYGDKKRH
jgi:hypothetical protein